MAWHPSGSIVGVGLSNNRIKLYDIKVQKLIQYYRVTEGQINDLSFHPSGNYLLAASDDGTIKILDLLEARQLYTITGHSGPVTAVKFSADGKHFVTGGLDKHIMLWKSNFVEQQKLNALAGSMPGEIHVDCIKDENDADDENEIKHCPTTDSTVSVVNGRRSDNYELSDIEDNN